MEHEFGVDERRLTFSQRHGYRSLPRTMRAGELSEDLRRETWDIVWNWLESNKVDSFRGSYFLRPFDTQIRRVLARFLQKSESDVNIDVPEIYRKIEKQILSGDFHLTLDLVEHMSNTFDEKFSFQIKDLYKDHGAAYWLDTAGKHCQFVSCSSPEQAAVTERAIEYLDKEGMNSATEQLRDAADHIDAQQYADAVQDCIHAVEAVARKIDPKASNALTPALASLEKAGVLNHPALKQAFGKLYGYTCDEEGIRHARVYKDVTEVGADEALFFFGACASFAAYLTQKHRAVSSTD